MVAAIGRQGYKLTYIYTYLLTLKEEVVYRGGGGGGGGYGIHCEDC